MERGVFVQRSMGPRHIIIGGISAWDPAQVRFAKHDHVVETFAADRADESLNVSILPGRSGCDRIAACSARWRQCPTATACRATRIEAAKSFDAAAVMKALDETTFETPYGKLKYQPS